ncbi:MAG: hypothetical protein KC503_19655 [Myxococcales bacterium]|nr:hypothetical protein [Myxococcales bacterium]
MSDLVRVVPESAAQILEKLQKLAENYKHVSAIDVTEGPDGPRIVIDLSGTANFFGNPDFYLPVRDMAGARTFVAHLTQKIKSGATPSMDDARRLFDLIAR